MAISKDNIITEGLSGMIGNVIVFRQLRGKTIIANRPSRPRFQSELQRENRRRFKAASAFARTILQDPDKKAYYLVKARKLKLPNAYTAALTDYMRKPAVTAIKYKGSTRGDIAITAGKAGFSLASVTVTMVNAQGEALATRMAVLKDRQKHEWIARLTPDLSMTTGTINGECVAHSHKRFPSGAEGSSAGRRIMVTATDHLGNVASHVLAA